MSDRISGSFTGERALFMAHDLSITHSVFEDGESPLKHSRNISLYSVGFKWKYPLWYSKDISVSNSTFFEMARAGIWYTDNVILDGIEYIAPKGFRRCTGVKLRNIRFPNAAETLWDCKKVSIKDAEIKGDYFAMNSEDIEISGMSLDGNYSFDGARNVSIKNSRLMSKDAFWNSENITAEDCYINGEYLGWNSKNLTLINCTIESLQGLCFCENLKLIGCRLENTTLALEYSTVDAEIIGTVESIKNPLGGVIKAGGIGHLIMESDRVDPAKTKILIKGE